MQEIGLETYTHSFSLPSLPGSTGIGSLHLSRIPLPYTNVYGILRARSAADRREAIVIVP
jgi:hypothetical protein